MTRASLKAGLSATALAAAMTALCAGCAGVSMPTMLSPATTAESGTPHVQKCGVVSISSPSKYVCDGKVYTTFQLAKLRADETKKYESGK